MSIRTGKLTVFFEEPFWVGIFERVENGKLSVSKVTFGTEPKDYEIWEFVLKEYDRLQFSPSVEVTEKETNKKTQRSSSVKFINKCWIGALEQNLSKH